MKLAVPSGLSLKGIKESDSCGDERQADMKTQIGHYKNGGSFSIDLIRLIETSLLIQANSGGGKSYLIRKILEATHGPDTGTKEALEAAGLLDLQCFKDAEIDEYDIKVLKPLMKK